MLVGVAVYHLGVIISSYKHLTLTGIGYNASRLLNENIKKNTKITLNYQQLSNEFGDNNWLVPKKRRSRLQDGPHIWQLHGNVKNQQK